MGERERERKQSCSYGLISDKSRRAAAAAILSLLLQLLWPIADAARSESGKNVLMDDWLTLHISIQV